MVALAWLVLTLVFLDELAAMAAFGVWGWQVGDPSALWVVVLPLTAMVAWWLFASPEARYGDAGRRETVKVLVLGLASLALWGAGHHGWAVVLLVLSVVVNLVALHPLVREVGART
jgi:Protein of unknown function (DUF2568)